MVIGQDNITIPTPLTEDQLAKVRAKAIATFGEKYGIEKFTCDDCGARFTCTLVFDAYNTDGDCLAEK